MSFHVGQKIVCVDDSWGAYWRGLLTILPRKDSIYTIREIQAHRDIVGFCFHEFASPVVKWETRPPSEAAFTSTHFRPVIERKPDISVFTEMLTPSKQKVDA